MSILAWVLSALGVGGFGALLYLVGPVSMLAGAKTFFGLLAKIPWQVYVIAAIIAAFAYLIHDRNKWKDLAAGYNLEASKDYAAAIKASGNKKLERKDTVAQILDLGSGVTTLQTALGRQSATIDAMTKKSAQQQQQYQQAAKTAQTRADEAEATSARLKASARAGGPSAGDCEPSETLQEQWSS